MGIRLFSESEYMSKAQRRQGDKSLGIKSLINCFTQIKMFYKSLIWKIIKKWFDYISVTYAYNAAHYLSKE